MYVLSNSSTNTHRKKRKSVTVPASLKASTNSSSVAESLYFPQQMKHFRNMTHWLSYYWTQHLISAHHNKPPLYGTKTSPPPPFPWPQLIVSTQYIKIENKINKSSEGLNREKSVIKLETVKNHVNAICGLSLMLVLSFVRRGFTLGTPVFPTPQKTNMAMNQVDEEPLCGCATSKSFIYLFIYIFHL